MRAPAGAVAALSRALPPGAALAAARPAVGWSCCAASGSSELAAMLELAPGRAAAVAELRQAPAPPRPRTSGARASSCWPAARSRCCAPSINDATIRLLARRGVDVEVAAGRRLLRRARPSHGPTRPSAIAFAKRNVDAWSQGDGQGRPVDAIIINASGCGTTVKDYGHLLKREPEYAERAATHLRAGARRHRVPRQLRPRRRPSAGRRCASPITPPARCSTASASPTSRASCCATPASPSSTSRRAHICCGSAGTYNILQPEIAGELRDRKVDNIKRVRPDVVATGNIGCITQLAGRLDVPVVHTVELLDWAYGGPVPRGPGAARALRLERARAQARAPKTSSTPSARAALTSSSDVIIPSRPQIRSARCCSRAVRHHRRRARLRRRADRAARRARLRGAPRRIGR